MRIIRFIKNGKISYGAQNDDGSVFIINGNPLISDQGVFSYSVTRRVISGYELLAPLIPSSIICIGLNYRKHAEESGAKLPEHPIVFMKLPSTVQKPEGSIVLPRHLRSDMVDYECELAVIIGKHCYNATRDNALDYVLGYTCGNDVSARDWQEKWGGGQWCRGKTFDTFCPLGPAIVTTDEIPNPNCLNISTSINGELLQNWNTEDMIFDVRDLIVFLSGSTTLEPGTVIMTGTPHGVGGARKPPRFLKAGDNVTVNIEKIGNLNNKVVEE